MRRTDRHQAAGRRPRLRHPRRNRDISTMRRRGILRLSLVAAALAAVPSQRLLGQDTTAVVSDSASSAVDTTADSTGSPQFSSAPAGTPMPPQDTTFVVDRVVAVVANRPVLASQVDEELFSRQSQGVKLPTDSAGLERVRQDIVSSIIDEELLVQQAQRDTSIKVTDEEIASGVEEQVRKVRSNFTSEVEYAAELKKAGFQTPEEYRRWLTDQQRRAAYQNRLIEKLRNDGKLKPVAPTEKEMKEFF